MPPFTAIALDRLVEPGGTKPMQLSRDSHESKIYSGHRLPESAKDRATYSLSSTLESGVSVTPNPKLGRGVSVPPNTNMEKELLVPPDKFGRRHSTAIVEQNHHWTQISPALYATPESTPLPDSLSPSSFRTSPYIINHKRRGPRLMKSLSEDDVASHKPCKNENLNDNGKGVLCVSKDDSCIPGEVMVSTKDAGIEFSSAFHAKEKYINCSCSGDHESIDMQNDPKGKSGLLHMQRCPEEQNGVLRPLTFNIRPNSGFDEFVDPQDSISVKSIGGSEGTGWEERNLNATTPLAEFYDAWEELSSASGSYHAWQDIETELCEIRSSLLMEIEQRKIVEETLHDMQTQWQNIREKFSLVGLTLPADPTTMSEGEQQSDLAADLCQQIYIARVVANSIGRGIAKAEFEMEMEAQIKLKNFEIARLSDRLRYYEAVNQEMSQRNQDVLETARRLRQRRKRRQKWVWTSIVATISIGSAVLAYSYFHSGKVSSSQASSPNPPG